MVKATHAHCPRWDAFRPIISIPMKISIDGGAAIDGVAIKCRQCQQEITIVAPVALNQWEEARRADLLPLMMPKVG